MKKQREYWMIEYKYRGASHESYLNGSGGRCYYLPLKEKIDPDDCYRSEKIARRYAARWNGSYGYRTYIATAVKIEPEMISEIQIEIH